MRICNNDPLEKIVREQLKANPVEVPRMDIQPMLAITKEGKVLKLFSKISDLVFGKTLDLEKIKIANESVADKINLKPSSKISIENAVKIAEGYLKNSGIPAFNISSLFEQDTQIAFRFENVSKKYFLPAQLTNQINGCLLQDENLAEEILDANIKLFIIDAIYECSDFSWVIDKNSQAKVKLDIISKLDTKVSSKLKVNTSDDFSITFKGEPRTFAFNCFPVSLTRDKKIKAEGFKQGSKLSFNSDTNENNIVENVLLSDEHELYEI